MLLPNDLSIHMVWGHLMSDIKFQEKDKEYQKLFSVTVHGLLKEAGQTINRENVMAKYQELTED